VFLAGITLEVAMSSANRVIGGMVGCVVLIAAGWVFAQDWPQWRGPNRDGKVTGFTAPETWPKALTQKWKQTVGAGDATPALVGEKLYVFARQGDDEVTLCLSAADGKELWKDKYAAPPVTGPSARQHPGPRSSPTLSEGKIVTLGATGVLSCLDTDGKVLWRNDEFKAVPRFFTAMSPIIVDGMAIAQLGGPGAGTTLALDLVSGQPKWKWTGDGPGYASPVLMTVDGTKQIVTLTDKSVVGLATADGKLLWQIPFAPQGMAYNAATPIVDGQTVIYTGQGRGTKAVKVEKQGDGFATKELWSNAQPAPQSTTPAPEATPGRPMERGTPPLAPQFNTPVLKDGLLFGLSDRGNLFCLNAQTGQTAWTGTARLANFGAILDAGSVLLALPNNSELIAYKPDGKQYVELAKIKVSDAQTYAHPVVAGKRVFVKDAEAVTLWTIE
jgi:outer membrane protein assembly factor BamB